MKKSRILIAGLLLIGMSLQAQKIYLRGGLGAAVSTAADFTINVNNSSEPGITTSKKQGPGSGLPFVLAAGYNLSKNFSLELGVDYFYGFNCKQEFSFTTSTYEGKWRGQMLSLVPALVMSLPFDKFKPYARLGLKVGVLNSYVVEHHDVYDSIFKAAAASDVVDSKIKYYGGIAVGVQAAVGTDVVLSDLVSLFGEIQVDGIGYAPKHGKYTGYSENGVDKMDSRTVKQNQWNFVKELDGNKTIPDDQPNEYIKTNIQFGNVGLVIGVKFNL
jgi:hypothetical protein